MPYISQVLLSTENNGDFTDGDGRGRKDESKRETAKRGTGELATQGLQVGRPLPRVPLVWRTEDCPPYLLLPARRAKCLSKV